MAKKSSVKNLPAVQGAGLTPAEVADFEQQAIDAARDVDAREIAGASRWISIRNSRFTYGEQILKGPLKVIVLDFGYERAWFEAAFNPDNMTGASCFALSWGPNGIVPHESAPKKQSSACDVCPRNVFGTADQGRGKACREYRRLALLSLETEEPSMAFIRVPPTSLNNWGRYVKGLKAQTSKPPYLFFTDVNLIEDAEWPTLSFAMNSEVPKDPRVYALIQKYLAEAKASLLTPPQVQVESKNGVPAKNKKAAPAAAGKPQRRKF